MILAVCTTSCEFKSSQLIQFSKLVVMLSVVLLRNDRERRREGMRERRIRELPECPVGAPRGLFVVFRVSSGSISVSKRFKHF